MSARDDFDADAPELRILSGSHAGARTPAVDGLTLGRDEDADIVLSDLEAGMAVARLGLGPDGHWSLGDSRAPLGTPLPLGGLALTVSPAHADWQKAPARFDRPVAAALPVVVHEPPPVAVENAVTEPRLDPSVPLVGAVPPQASRPGKSLSGRLAASPLAIALGALLLLLVPVLFALLGRGQVGTPSETTARPDAQAATRAVELGRAQAAVALAVAGIDPGLRLQVTARPGGGAQVAGWVASNTQFDAVAEALASLRPVPALRLRVVSELRDELRGQLGTEGAGIDFQPLSAGRMQVLGTVTSANAREQMLATIRALAPRDIEVVDGLRLAADQAPALEAALRAAGFKDANARWDGRQVAIGLTVSAPDRGRLEEALMSLGRRFPGVPFSVTAQPVAVQVGVTPAGAPLMAPPGAVPMASAGLPFSVRGIVGGPSAFLVLGDGSKLLVGGSRGGWRLAAVENDYLVFDQPRRLMVLR